MVNINSGNRLFFPRSLCKLSTLSTGFSTGKREKDLAKPGFARPFGEKVTKLTEFEKS
jgi:hypothetical protein